MSGAPSLPAPHHGPARPARRSRSWRARLRAWPWPLTLAMLGADAQAVLFLPGAAADPATGDAPTTTAASAPAGPQREPLRAPGLQWRLAPWQFGGTVALDSRWLHQADGQTARQMGVFSDFEWASYVWQPWFIQLRLGLGVLASRDDARSGEASSSSQGGTLTGRMAVSVFPASRFPFELRAELGDSRSSGESLGSEVRTQRLSLSQSYRPEVGADHLNLRIEHSRLQASDSRDTLTSVQAQAQRLAGDHSLDLGANWSLNQRSDSGDRSRQASLNAHHGFHPSEDLQVETLASWNQQRLQADGRAGGGAGSDFGSEVRQINSVASWRPAEGEPLYDEERALLVAASARWVEARAIGAGDGQSAQVLNGSLGASLTLSTAWRMAASLSATRVSSGSGGGSQAYNANANAGWTPASQMLAGWRYAPTANLNAGLALNGSNGLRRQIGLQGSHSVSRDWPFGEGQQLAINLSQSAALLHETLAGTPVRALAHSAGLFWQAASEDGQQRFAGLSVNDSRTRARSDGSFQLVNLQLSQRSQLSRQTSWSANLTLQATRNQANELDAFTGERRSIGAGWQHFYSGGISLEQQRLFGVPRLRHTLQLSANSQQIERRSAGDIDAPRERIGASLESRVDYAIGRLEMRLSARWAQVEDRAVAAVLARLQRRF